MERNVLDRALGRPLTRRNLLRGGVMLGAAVAAAPALAACGGGGASSSRDQRTLNILTWETYHDPAWLAEVKQATGITVNAVTAGSAGEMVAKVRAAPAQYDLVMVTAGVYRDYTASDLLVPVDEARVPGLSDKIRLSFDWRGAATVDGKRYGILYNWGNQPLVYDDSVANSPAASKYKNSDGVVGDWNILWDPAFARKVSVFDDPVSVLPMIPLSLGIADPYHLSDADFARMKDKLMALRPQIRRLTSGFNDQTTQFANGEARLGYLNNITSVSSLAGQGKKLNVNNTPGAGVPAWTDSYAITKAGAERLDAVYQFIAYTLTVPWQARFVAASGNAGVLDGQQAGSAEAQRAGLTPERLAATQIPATAAGDAFFSKMKFFQTTENQQARLNLWNEFKLGLG
ncbi:ABC transporter substrate-binding protein [Sphaerisporangium sp. NPDC051017]|uniref:ABC transporter substrate-binding protein n=1 Tax=Sphaerisporangium sp. NPDC051017 TaxID=3154636 RepID=UPI003415DAAA